MSKIVSGKVAIVSTHRGSTLDSY